MAIKFVGIKEFRQNMAKISNQARKQKQRLIILRKNEPIFELRPLSKKELDLEKLLLEINEAKEDAKKDRVYSNKEMKQMFGIK